MPLCVLCCAVQAPARSSRSAGGWAQACWPRPPWQCHSGTAALPLQHCCPRTQWCTSLSPGLWGASWPTCRIGRAGEQQTGGREGRGRRGRQQPSLQAAACTQHEQVSRHSQQHLQLSASRCHVLHARCIKRLLLLHTSCWCMTADSPMPCHTSKLSHHHNNTLQANVRQRAPGLCRA